VTDYTDDSFVYVDPNARSVMGIVQWLPNGKAKPLPVPERTESAEGGKPGEKQRHFHRKPKQHYFPWCSYRTAKRVYRVAGKDRETEVTRPLEEALTKSLQEPYWD